MSASPNVGLIHDPVHGYIPFVSDDAPEGEAMERDILDHPWVQRLRQIHQLQTAWWVFPSAEHSRFQHVVGVMHLASRAVAKLYDSLQDIDASVPSRGYVEVLMRMAGLLHDVGHGPFGHFLDDKFLSDFGLNHEILGTTIIRQELGDLLLRLRRCPNSALADDETLDPAHVALLIARPQGNEPDQIPTWLRRLRSLFSGIYTVDNMDFVLRDAYMTGYSARAFDLDRILHYSFFSEQGLTIHHRGLEALLRFVTVRGELFRNVYFHRTVRAIDLTLADLFVESKPFLFPGNPLDHLDAYRSFTEWSLLVDVARWDDDSDPRKRELGQRWRKLLARQIPWKMLCQRNLIFREGDSERASVFANAKLLEQAIRGGLASDLAHLEFRVDLARHIHRPDTRGPAAGQNFWFDPANNAVRPLHTDLLFKQLPLSQRVCRLYAQDHDHARELTRALDDLIGPYGVDDITNM